MASSTKKPKAVKKSAPALSPSARLNQIGIDAICEHVSGGESLLSWCNANKFAYNTVLNWIEGNTERSANYARARDVREEQKFDDLETIGDQAACSESAVQVAGLRLKADNLKWKLARMNPKRFGDKVQHGGADDLPPIGVSHGMGKDASALLSKLRNAG